MVETSDDPSLLDRIRSIAHVSKSGLFRAADRPFSHHPSLPVTNTPTCQYAGTPTRSTASSNGTPDHATTMSTPSAKSAGYNTSTVSLSPVSPSQVEGENGEASSTIEHEPKKNIATRFFQITKEILLSSILNVLLVFVPVGIAVNFARVNPTIVFAMNAIAIIPLAGLLSHATESVASSMGDTVGALMNVTFGNAVELIIFIALKENQIRIVQASLLGSILANLLLILGMCFLCGGLRFREQIYNSTVTQLSACLLSLSVMSLLLPTAFHASFTDNNLADVAVLQVSRGSSIILLLVYVLYLLFQLKSHAYLYESTPQHVIDEESHPGLLADMLGSSSSSDTSGSSNDSDSDASSGSHTTANRIRRAFRGRRRRKSSASSKDTPSSPSVLRTPSAGTFIEQLPLRNSHETASRCALGAIASGDEADTDGENDIHEIRTQAPTTMCRDFENEKSISDAKSPDLKLRKKSKRQNKKFHSSYDKSEKQMAISEKEDVRANEANLQKQITPGSQRVSFVQDVQIMPDNSPKRPFNIRGLSVVPTMQKMFPTTVFSAANPTGLPTGGPLAPMFVPPAPYSLRRTNSLPDRLNKNQSTQPVQQQTNTMPLNASSVSVHSGNSDKVKKYMSRPTAICLLLVSTALVAVCAEFLVSSINYLVDNTSVSEAFVGLIILPIVGNAAEHVTAVTVASKNKMDLAIGVAVGSSIQIALFVTPVIVLLGWILNKDMSLYFSLFETISLFVSAFIVNFLVLDGRSNYLEGALLIAAYIIIALAAFFYPNSSQQSTIGGAQAGVKMMMMTT